MSDLIHRRHVMDFDSAVALRYHSRRRGTLDALAKAGTAASLLLGASAFAGLLAGSPQGIETAKWLAAVVAAVNGINLVFGVADAGRKHGELFKRWADFRAKLVVINPDDTLAISLLEVERAKLDGDSPTQLDALSVLVENEEKQIRRSGLLYRVGPVQRLLAPIFTLPGWQPKPWVDASTIEAPSEPFLLDHGAARP